MLETHDCLKNVWDKGLKINTQERNSHLLGKNMRAILERKVSENDDWTITTDMRRAELYNYRYVLPTSMMPG